MTLAGMAPVIQRKPAKRATWIVVNVDHVSLQSFVARIEMTFARNYLEVVTATTFVSSPGIVVRILSSIARGEPAAKSRVKPYVMGSVVMALVMR